MVWLCAASVAAVAAALSLFQVCDPDVFWHLKTGEVILQTGRLVRANLFSHTYPGHPWSNPEWLFQTGLALVHSRLGWAGVAALKSLLVVALALSLYVLLVRRGGSPLLAAALVLIALATMRSRLTERPHLVSYLLFVLNMSLLAGFRREGTRRLWPLLALYVVWGNVHPELILGLLFMGAVVAGDFIDGLTHGNGSGRIGPYVPLLLCIPAAMANPETYRVLAYPFLHLNVGTVIDVNEFGGTTLSAAPLFFAFLAVSLAGVASSRERRNWSELLPMAGMGLLAILYKRMVPYYLFVSLPVLLRATRERSAASRWLSPRVLHGTAALAAAGAVAWAAWGDTQLPYRWGWGIREDRFPVSAARFLESEPLPGNLYNHYNDGGYLIHRLFPGRPVFQDGRVPSYPREFLVALHSRHDSHGFFRVLERYGVGTALVRTADAALFPQAGWGLAYWDDNYAVLVRRSPESRDVLARHEYRVFRPYSQAKWSRDPSMISAMVDEMARNQAARLRPSGELARDIGIACGQLGRTAEAEASLALAVRLSPSDPIGWLYLGKARLETGRAEEAIRPLERAMQLAPDLEKAKLWLEEARRAAGSRSR